MRSPGVPVTLWRGWNTLYPKSRPVAKDPMVAGLCEKGPTKPPEIDIRFLSVVEELISEMRSGEESCGMVPGSW